MELINEQLRQIRETLERLERYQLEMNGRVSQHQRWIDKRENEIDTIDDRFHMGEAGLDDLQRWRDRLTIERGPQVKDFEEMKQTVREHALTLRDQTVVKKAWWDTVREWGMLLALVATALKLFKVIP